MRQSSTEAVSRRGLLRVGIVGLGLVVAAPLAAAGALSTAGSTVPLGPAGEGVVPGAAVPIDVERLLANPNLAITGWATNDLRAGIVDPRIVDLLAAMADHWPLYVLMFKSGHSYCIGGSSDPACPGTRPSNHSFGRAVDIMSIGGQPVSPRNPNARDAVLWLLAQPAPYRPGEIGSPFHEFDPLPGAYSDAAHQNHLHIGFNR
jgi:hypothetical protein